MPPRYQPNIQVPDWVIVSAVRYAQGRNTYIVKDTCDLVKDVWKDINPTDQEVILKDLETEARSSLNPQDIAELWQDTLNFARQEKSRK